MKKEEKTKITKAKIFDAAIEEFGANGYATGSLNNICKSGINKGLIYHNYKDKDELYLECVKKSCNDLLCYVQSHQAKDGFVAYMNARSAFFLEHKLEAYIFLEARTNPPQQLINQIQELLRPVDDLNRRIFEKELFQYELREGVSKDDAISYFYEIQKIYNHYFTKQLSDKMTMHEQLDMHEMNIHKILDLILYGIAKGEKEV